MNGATAPPAWQIRLLAAAVAALTSASAAFVSLPTVIGPFFCVVGIPVGALVGLCYGPSLVHGERDKPLEQTVAALATAIGTMVVGVGFAIQQSRGASLPEVSELAFLSTSLLGLISIPLGYPFTRFVTQLAVRASRHLMEDVAILWLPALLILLLVAGGTVTVAGAVFRPAGFFAVEKGEQATLRFRIHSVEMEPDQTLELRSYVDGEMVLSDEAAIDRACVEGIGHVLETGWSVWIANEGDQDYGVTPPGEALMTSGAWSGGDPIALTIFRGLDGHATWRPGIDEGQAC